jgi:hypothetical protein
VLLPRRLVVPAVVAICSLGLAACGDDNGDKPTTSAGAPGGELFAQTGLGGTLTPIKGENDVYDLTLTGASPDVTQFTDRPVRKASSESLAAFVGSWQDRGFAQNPPNAALVIDQQSENADTSVFTLADPKYNEAAGELTYRATHVEGGTAALPHPDQHVLPPPKFGQAHLFVDPGSTPITDVLVVIDGAPADHNTVITLDSQFEVFVGPGEQSTEWQTLARSNGAVGGQAIRFEGNGEVGFQVTGAEPPITGSAQIASGSGVTMQVNGGTPQPVRNGRFSVGG